MERCVMHGAVAAAALVMTACGSHSPRLDVGPVPSGVVVDARIQYYDVTAANLTELRRGMARLGPKWEGRSFQAATHSQYGWAFQYDRRGAHCALSRVKVQVRTVVTFPRWNPSAEPDSAALEWWHQLNAGLMEHERGHAQLSVKTAGEIAEALQRISHPQCDGAGLQATATGGQLIGIERRKQVEYDFTTRHGATQIEQAGRLRAP